MVKFEKTTLFKALRVFMSVKRFAKSDSRFIMRPGEFKDGIVSSPYPTTHITVS